MNNYKTVGSAIDCTKVMDGASGKVMDGASGKVMDGASSKWLVTVAL